VHSIEQVEMFGLTPEDACVMAIKKAGGPTEVARKFTDRGFKMSPQNVDKWKKVPPHHTVLLSELAGGHPTVHQLRPDVFGPAPGVPPR
jgi:hypothetical protein